MRLSAIGSALLFTLLQACAPPLPPAPLVPQRTHVTNYTTGDARAVTVGEPIFEVQPAFLRPAYTVRRDYAPPRPSWSGKPGPLSTGMRFEAVAIFPDSSLFLRNADVHQTLGIRVRPDGVVSGGWVELSGKAANDATEKTWPSAPLFAAAEDPVQRKGAFRAELLYSGLTGSTLKATYREFIDETARPAFFQELQYELGEGRVISYKSIRIEVLNATNTRLEYRVLDDGGLPWLP